jgi:predicted nucleotidyltransferase
VNSDWDGRIRAALLVHPGVRDVRLSGSRARGEATAYSDWDFEVTAVEFAEVADALPELVRPLDPLAQLWDPLSRHYVYALVLRGPVKIDLVFDEPHELEPPWTPGPETLAALDAHFWDWLLWLTGKRHRGERGLVRDELSKMHDHLLGPLGVGTMPGSLEEAATAYVAARDRAERRFGVHLPKDLEAEVRRRLA